MSMFMDAEGFEKEAREAPFKIIIRKLDDARIMLFDMPDTREKAIIIVKLDEAELWLNRLKNKATEFI